MRKKYFYVSLAAIFSVTSSLHAANATDLKEALAKAYLNNPALAAGRSSLKATDELLPQALSGYLPNVNAEYNRSKQDIEYNTGTEDNGISEVRQLTLRQPVFRGFETVSQTKRAENLIRAGRENLKQVEQNVLSQSVVAYIDVVQAQEILKLSTNNENVLNKQLGATRERFDLGENTKTDVSQSEARYARATSDRIQAEGRLIAAKATYERLIGEKPIDLRMPAKLPVTANSIDEVIAKALDSNPALKRAEHTSAAAKNDVSILKSRLLPTVSLVGQLSEEKGLNSSLGNERDTQSVGLSISVPIFQSGAEYSRVRQSKRTAEQRRQEQDDEHNATVEGATRAWRDLETARATITSTSSAVKAAQVALEGVRQESEVGSRTTLDVLNAEQELFIARVDAVDAKRNEVVAAYNVKAVMGELTAQGIGLNVPVYDPKKHSKDVRYQMIGF